MEKFPEEELAELKAACFEYWMPDNRPTPRANVSTVPLLRLIAFVEGLRGLQEAYDAAVDYIDKSPCDPDIYPDQWKAWERYLNAKAALPAAPVGK